MEDVQRALQGAIEKVFSIKVNPVVTNAPENTGADYASNIAMQLAKLVHKAPMVIAEMIKGELSDAEYEVEIAVPGFLNFKFRSDAIIGQIQGYAADLVQEVVVRNYEGKKVVAEFSDPNPFKVLHVGHLYTSIVGDSIARLLEFAGADVVRANFGGDVGLHVAKTLYALLQEADLSSLRSTSSKSATAPSQDLKSSSVRCSTFPRISSKMTSSKQAALDAARSASPSSLNSTHSKQSNEEVDTSSKMTSSKQAALDAARSASPSSLNSTHSKQSNEEVDTSSKMTSSKQVAIDEFIDNLTIEDIAKCYVEGTRAYEEDEVAKAEITELNKEIYRINSEDQHDSVLAQLYWRGRELSYQYFDGFYAQIGVRFDKYYPESTVADRGLLEVRVHTGTTYEESDGAVVYKGEKIGLHTRVFINREGVPTYETKDVGLLFTKWDDWHFDESVVVTGNEQGDYMKVVLASVAEYAPQLVDRTSHLTHGLVKLPGNVKMSSRKGNFLRAVDVLQLIEDQLRANVAMDRSADGVDFGQLAEVDDRQHKILLAAVKYAFLKYKMGGDIVFDPQESVSMTGNSGIYLLYSAVRAKKILQKDVERQFESTDEEIELEKTFEKKLCKKIIQYKDVLMEAVKEKAPYKVCNYLYELSQEFSRFYEHVKVAGNQREVELKQVVRAYYNVMEHGLDILGIAVPEAM